jgi:outer membrane biosynthesis protein TonB
MRITIECDTNEPGTAEALAAMFRELDHSRVRPEPGTQICRPGEPLDETVTIWAPDGKHKLAEGNINAMAHVKAFEYETTEPAPEPKAEPAPEPKAEPAPEPKAEPAPEPKAEPAQEPKAEDDATLEKARVNSKRIRELLLEAAGLPDVSVDDAKRAIFDRLKVKNLRDISASQTGEAVEVLTAFIAERKPNE